MSVSVSTQLFVYNEAAVIVDCLDNIYPLVDQLVIVEGAWTGQTGDNRRSDDGTRQLVDSYADPDGKITVLDSDGDEVHCRNMALGHAEGEWLLLVAADERWTRREMRKLRSWLGKLGDAGVTAARVLAPTFYFSHDWYLMEDPAYVKRLVPGMRFTRPTTTTVDRKEPRIPVRFWHFAYVGRDRVRRKLELYGEEGAEYFERVFGPVSDEPTHAELEQAYARSGNGGIHMRYPGWRLMKYSGPERFDDTVAMLRGDR